LTELALKRVRDVRTQGEGKKGEAFFLGSSVGGPGRLKDQESKGSAPNDKRFGEREGVRLVKWDKPAEASTRGLMGFLM
jgi:hypothetical protein